MISISLSLFLPLSKKSKTGRSKEIFLSIYEHLFCHSSAQTHTFHIQVKYKSCNLSSWCKYLVLSFLTLRILDFASYFYFIHIIFLLLHKSVTVVVHNGISMHLFYLKTFYSSSSNWKNYFCGVSPCRVTLVDQDLQALLVHQDKEFKDQRSAAIHLISSVYFTARCLRHLSGCARQKLQFKKTKTKTNTLQLCTTRHPNWTWQPNLTWNLQHFYPK